MSSPDSSLPSSERLDVLFRRPPELKVNPEAIGRVLQSLEPVYDALKVTEAIEADPCVALRFLRTCGTFEHTQGYRTLSVLAAAKRMDANGIRSFVSQTVLGGFVGSNFIHMSLDRARIVRHSLFVARLLRHFSEIQDLHRAGETPDEFYMCGLLHDLGVKLLGKMSPETFAAVANFGVQCGVTFETAFMCKTNVSLHLLSRRLVEAWRLDPVLANGFLGLDETQVSDGIVLRQGLALADFLARESGYAWENWPILTPMSEPLAEFYEEYQSAWDEALALTLQDSSKKQAA